MQIQNSNYIPINSFSKNDLIKEEIESIKEEIKLSKEIIDNNKQIIDNNNKQIGILQEKRDLMQAQFERSEKTIANVKKGLAELAPFKAYCEKQLGIKAHNSYNTANSISNASGVATRVDDIYSGVTQGLANINSDNKNIHPVKINKTPAYNSEQDNEFIKNVRELGSLLYKDTVNWSTNSTPFIELFKTEYNSLMKDKNVFNQKIRDIEQKIYEKKQILQNYSKSISGSVVGSRIEENEIDKIVSDIFKLEKEVHKYVFKNSTLTNEYMGLISNQKTSLSTILDGEPNALIAIKDPENILREGDLMLTLGNPKKALGEYNKILANRGNKPVEKSYYPTEEKLRQAAKLYTSFQPIIDKFNISDALKLNLYCSGIAAHTTGIFSLSKSEVLHMINNQFYYTS